MSYSQEFKLLIVVWGNPWRFDIDTKSYCGYNWDIVEYRINDKCDYSRTSLRLLMKYVNPNKCYIIVLDTVAFKQYKSYGDLKDDIKRMYLNFIQDELKIEKSDIKILVSPGVGDFPNGLFEGSMSDFYHYVYYAITKELVQDLPEDADIVEFHVDLSHGINFMPTLTYNVIKEISGALALVYNHVRLIVYNSEPYVRGVKRLNIHIVEQCLVKPEVSRYGLRQRGKIRFIEPLGLSDDKRRELDEKQRQCVKDNNIDIKELNVFLGALINGLPLALLTFFPNVESIGRCLEELVNIYERFIEITFGDKLKVIRKTKLTENISILSKIYLIASMLSRKLGLHRKTEVSLSELERLRKNLYSKNDKLDAQISRDLREVQENWQRVPQEWTPLKDVIGSEGGFDPRNFIAHSGLEKNVTEVKRINSEILLRYRQSREEKKKIIEAAIKGLET